MYKKISKTIILVVFLTFFGIMKVNAVDQAKCIYKYSSSGALCSGVCGTIDGDETKTQTLYIAETGNVYFEDKYSQYHTDNIHNWYKSDSEKTSKIFNGSDYFKKNKKCPEYLIADADPNWDEVYFSDKKSYDKIVDEIFGFGNPEATGRTTFTLEKTEIIEKKSDSNESKSCKPKSKSNKNYSDPNVLPQEPLENDFTTYSCGKSEKNNEYLMTGIPINVPKFTKFIYNFIQFLVPLTLIILGSIDLIKSITGGKEDEIKKGQQVFIKRLVSGALVFFSLAIVKFIVSAVSTESSRIANCINCFITGGSECVKDKDLPQYSYTNINTSDSNECEE